MTKKIKTGKVEISSEEFKEDNVSALISIRLPLKLVKDLRKLSLNEKYQGRYQVLLKDILQKHVEATKNK